MRFLFCLIVCLFTVKGQAQIRKKTMEMTEVQLFESKKFHRIILGSWFGRGKTQVLRKSLQRFGGIGLGVAIFTVMNHVMTDDGKNQRSRRILNGQRSSLRKELKTAGTRAVRELANSRCE